MHVSSQIQIKHPEIILADKPKGISSFQFLRELKKKLGIQREKVGHAGTLDPNASGLMIVGIGAGTKKLKDYVGLDKTYDAEILLGTRTNTGDITGNVIEESEASMISEEKIKEVLSQMVGTLRLPVSEFSAMKRGGEPLYKKARRGEIVGVRPLRDMTVLNVEYISHEYRDGKCEVQARFTVESGVYIRSLAEEIGKRLGYPATLKNLRRTEVGQYSVNDENVIGA